MRTSWSSGSPPSMSAEIPVAIRLFKRSTSSPSSMMQTRFVWRNWSISADPTVRSSDRASRITRLGCHSIQRSTSEARGTTCAVANPYASRTLARAPASRLLPTINRPRWVAVLLGVPLRGDAHWFCPPAAMPRREYRSSNGPRKRALLPFRLRLPSCARPLFALRKGFVMLANCTYFAAFGPSRRECWFAVCLLTTNGNQLGAPLAAPTREARIPALFLDSQPVCRKNGLAGRAAAVCRLQERDKNVNLAL